MKFLNLAIASAILLSSVATAKADQEVRIVNDDVVTVIPVLVTLNAAGDVASAKPSTQLSPQLNTLLKEAVISMIKKPALLNKSPAGSQLVMNMGLQVTPRPTGDYDVQFGYVSAKALPAGSWKWTQTADRRLALVDDTGRKYRKFDSFTNRPYNEVSLRGEPNLAQPAQ